MPCFYAPSDGLVILYIIYLCIFFLIYRYLSLHDNKYIRYFVGHSKRVVSLCVSPDKEMFISASLDQSIKLWDLRSPNCQGHICVRNNPLVSLDPDGIVLAAGLDSETLKLYDIR